MTPLGWTPLAWATIALGVAVGPALARASIRLRDRAAAPSASRMLVMALACPALAAWAQAVHPGAPGVLGALLAWQLVLLALLDADDFWLPLPLTLALIASGLLAAAPEGAEVLRHRAVGAFAGWAALMLLSAAYRRLRGREGLGGGDAWLLAGGGAWVGWIALPTVLVWAAGAGLATAAALAVARRPIESGRHIPFGVPLAAGIWLAWLYGPIGRAGF
ncbi:prepilin peptidase [Phenylobacterium sp.]|uniref:prepilin peptidase n=1 Tax=Phenylobacterium sp. TaxID=1871053 RepID=UPI003950E062